MVFIAETTTFIPNKPLPRPLGLVKHEAHNPADLAVCPSGSYPKPIATCSVQDAGLLEKGSRGSAVTWITKSWGPKLGGRQASSQLYEVTLPVITPYLSLKQL